MKQTNFRVLTPRERMKEKILDYSLALVIGVGLAWLLVEWLSK